MSCVSEPSVELYQRVGATVVAGGHTACRVVVAAAALVLLYVVLFCVLEEMDSCLH